MNRIIHIGDLADHHSASFHDSEIGFTDIVGEMEAAREPCSDVFKNSRRFISDTYKTNKSVKKMSS